MSKILEFPKQEKHNVVQFERARATLYVFDLVEHRKKLIALQKELRAAKRALLRAVQDDEHHE